MRLRLGHLVGLLLIFILGCLCPGVFGGGRVVNLLPDGALQLYPNEFDDNTKVVFSPHNTASVLSRLVRLLIRVITQRTINSCDHLWVQKCTAQQTIRARYSAFALPINATALSFLVEAGLENCNNGILFGIGPLDIALTCSPTPALIVDGGTLGRVSFPMPHLASSGELRFVLSLDHSIIGQRISLCSSGAAIPPDTSAGAALFSYLSQLTSNLLASDIIIGSRDETKRTLRANLEQFLLRTDPPAAVDCQLVWTTGLPDSWSVTPRRLPQIVALEQFPKGDVVIEQEVRFAAKAVHPEGTSLKVELIVFGLPAAGCDATTCNDATFPAEGTAGSAQVTASVRFHLPGRFLVRFKAADGSGAVVSKDIYVLVRKIGDAQRAAPCCRHTAYVTAQQLGRPIDQTEFRGPSVMRGAERLGWSKEYLAGADMEAERLFDYSVLAPPPEMSPLCSLTCADTRLAGAGTPTIYGLLNKENEVSGHNKALTIVPQAFPWAEAGDVECQQQQHWSGWHETSPYARNLTIIQKNGTSSIRKCPVGCTKAGVELMIRTTGMIDQYNQALIQASYGKLSISPYASVLPEVLVSKEPIILGDDATGYYNVPGRQALNSQPGPRPWMHFILTPLSVHQSPPHRAWSAGMASGGAVITSCYAQFYYAVHETGHRMGFKHANVYKLDSALAAPSDPLGPGAFIKDAYSDALDIMSCCKGDYSMYHRTIAGWMRGSEREVLAEEDMVQAVERRMVLWPFDRSEARGRLMSVALRRSVDEVLLIGLRSASHWQEAGTAAPEEARQNVRGLQVEYLRRGSDGVWSERGLVDLNVVHGDWPDALPAGPKEFPRKSHFALLKEGYSWYDPASKVLLMLEKIGECPGTASLQPYNYTVKNFNGLRADWPFKERFGQADYDGFSALECAHITINTDASPPTGKLDIAISAAGSPLQDELIPAAGGPASRGLSAAIGGTGAQSCPSSSSSSGEILLTATWDSHNIIRSIVWKDGLNRTVASFSSQEPGQSDSLPRSVAVSALELPVSVHVLAWDGRHSRAEVARSANASELGVKYKMYEVNALSYGSDVLPLTGTPGSECTSGLVRLEEDVRWLIAGVSIVSAALLITVIGWALWLTRWWRRRTSRRRTASPPRIKAVDKQALDEKLAKEGE